jgi:hypothetical protein
MKLVQCEFGFVSDSTCQLSCHTVTKMFYNMYKKIVNKMYSFSYLPYFTLFYLFIIHTLLLPVAAFILLLFHPFLY